jgi:hypothetical protein
MPLILDENGKVINRTEKSIDSIKRESYKHPIKEEEETETEDVESFVDSLEELEDGEGEEDIIEDDLNPEAVEIAMEFADFKLKFVKAFGEDECQEAFLQFEDFFSGKGVDMALNVDEVADRGEIPGIESSEQSIMTSEVEEAPFR